MSYVSKEIRDEIYNVQSYMLYLENYIDLNMDVYIFYSYVTPYFFSISRFSIR